MNDVDSSGTIKRAVSFFRAGVHCIVRFDELTGAYWSYAGVERKHPLSDRSFYRTSVVDVFKVAPPPEATSDAVFTPRTWFGYESWSGKRALDTVRVVADEIASAKEGDGL